MNDLRSYDVVILGRGPAGLQSAIHAARKKVAVLVLGKDHKSSLYRAHIENFCCMFKASGEEILATGHQQASRFGTEFLDEDVLSVENKNDGFLLTTEGGIQIHCAALVIATGIKRAQLGIPGEKEFIGKGVSYCVDCDGHFYKGETVAVLGAESAAVDGALTLSQIGAGVHLVCDQLSVSEALKARLAQSPVQIHAGRKAKAIQGTQQVTGLQLDDNTILDVTGVFIEQGAKGLMELATRLGIRLDDEMRHIQTDKQQATNVEGVYAAGDICGPPWQMAKAVGEGCVAGIAAATYAKQRK